MNIFVCISGVLLFVVSQLAIVTSAGADELTEKERQAIQSADVYLHVALMRDELELLRFEMGRPSDHQPPMVVSNVAPREVFFLALTLFHKANRLAFEQTRERVDEPKIPLGEILTGHVWQVVDAALQRIQRVKNELGILEKSAPGVRNADKRPIDVFLAIVQADRQLNLLLERRFAPSDVFKQVTLAIAYSARLLSHFDGAQRIAATPPYQRGKQPVDVYYRLASVLVQLQKIGQQSGLVMLALGNVNDAAEITPSDVYDIASILVAELAYLHRQLGTVERPLPVHYPGRKFPSDVYQRVGILEAQLMTLQAQVDANPDWLHARLQKEEIAE